MAEADEKPRQWFGSDHLHSLRSTLSREKDFSSANTRRISSFESYSLITYTNILCVSVGTEKVVGETLQAFNVKSVRTVA